MASACSALYFLNLKGDILIQRTYRDDVECALPLPAAGGSVKDDLRESCATLVSPDLRAGEPGPSVLAYARPVVVWPAHMLFVLELHEPGMVPNAALSLDCLRRGSVPRSAPRDLRTSPI